MSETGRRAGRGRPKGSGKAARPAKAAAQKRERAKMKEAERVPAKQERASDAPSGAAAEPKPAAEPSAPAVEPAPSAAAAPGRDVAAEAAGAAQRFARARAAPPSRDLGPGFDEIVRFNRANLDAVMSTAGLAAEGARDVGRYLVEWQQEALRQGLEGMRQMMGARSVPAALAVQADLARRGASELLNRSARLSRLSASAAGRAAEPLRNRTTAAVAALSRRAG